jgi:methyltransferase FkbM-like protein
VKSPADVRLVKLDVEGAELEALCGAADLLSRRRPALIVEANGPENRRAVKVIVERFGYQQRALLDGRNVIFT